MKQTAVEYLINVVNSCIAPDYIPQEIIKQAKEMERQQNELWWAKGWEDGHVSTLQENTETIVTEYRDGTIKVETFKSE
jgi:hypothetical protein